MQPYAVVSSRCLIQYGTSVDDGDKDLFTQVHRRLMPQLVPCYFFILRLGIISQAFEYREPCRRYRTHVDMGIEEQFILLSLGLATILVRIGVRWRQVGPSGWELDDYLMPFTGVSSPFLTRDLLALQLTSTNKRKAFWRQQSTAHESLLTSCP